MSASKLKQTSNSAASAIGTAVGAVGDFAKHASEGVQHTAKQTTNQMHTGYNEAERFVRNRPGEAMLVCLGVGVLAGVLMALTFHSR